MKNEIKAIRRELEAWRHGTVKGRERMMDQAVTHAKAALEECIELRAEIERLRAALKSANDALALFCSHQIAHQDQYVVLGNAWRLTRETLARERPAVTGIVAGR